MDGGSDFSKIVVPNSFIGSIAGKLIIMFDKRSTHCGMECRCRLERRLWEIEMAVLAKDDRDLLNLHLTLPATDTNSTELVINRSPLQDNDLLPLWYWHLAKGNSSIVHNPLDNSIKLPFEAPSYDPNFSPSSINSLALWVDANDSSTITQTNGIISAWADKSGNERNATSGAGTPEITFEDGLNGLPFVKFRRASDDYLNVGGTIYSQHMFCMQKPE